MNKRLYTLIAILTFGTGLLYYALQEEWLIIRHPWWQTHQQQFLSAFTKKKVTIYAWHQKNWVREQIDMIWSEADDIENAKQLTQATLTLLFEEEFMKKKVTVETALKTINDTELILIFDRYPFSKTMAIRDKYLIIESILKTLRENGLKRTKIRFLANHQPINDPHIDFAQSWPLEGFLS